MSDPMKEVELALLRVEHPEYKASARPMFTADIRRLIVAATRRTTEEQQ